MLFRRTALVATRTPFGMRSFYAHGAAAAKISPVDAAIADTFASFAKVRRGSVRAAQASPGASRSFFFLAFLSAHRASRTQTGDFNNCYEEVRIARLCFGLVSSHALLKKNTHSLCCEGFRTRTRLTR